LWGAGEFAAHRKRVGGSMQVCTLHGEIRAMVALSRHLSFRATLKSLATSNFPPDSPGGTLHRVGMVNVFAGFAVVRASRGPPDGRAGIRAVT
jgi:hypothetical protein